MTEEQIALVRKTWKLFRGIDPGIVGDTFYSKLFSDNPALRRMFPTDMKEQYRKLINMLTTIVARLDRIEDLSGEISAMGKRHVEYGVRPSHYKYVGNALLWTLEQGLGSDWTPEAKEAWKVCFDDLARAMLK